MQAAGHILRTPNKATADWSVRTRVLNSDCEWVLNFIVDSHRLCILICVGFGLFVRNFCFVIILMSLVIFVILIFDLFCVLVVVVLFTVSSLGVLHLVLGILLLPVFAVGGLSLFSLLIRLS